MNSQDFTLTTNGTILVPTTEVKDLKIISLIISNEYDADKEYSLLKDNEVFEEGIVKGQYSTSIFDRVFFAQEAGTELKAIGDGLTLHMVYEDLNE